MIAALIIAGNMDIPEVPFFIVIYYLFSSYSHIFRSLFCSTTNSSAEIVPLNSIALEWTPSTRQICLRLQPWIFRSKVPLFIISFGLFWNSSNSFNSKPQNLSKLRVNIPQRRTSPVFRGRESMSKCRRYSHFPLDSH